jgi:hypothetical protein
MLGLTGMQPERRWNEFSLAEGGPLYYLATAMGLPRNARGLLYLGLAIAAITWLPLLILSAAENLLTSGKTIPFLGSLGTHARLLLTIPLFFVTQIMFSRRAGQAIRALMESKLIPEDQLPRLDAALTHAMKVRDSWVLEAGLLAMTALLISIGVRSDLPAEVTTWRSHDHVLTLAGRWYTFVSLPVFQFLFWRWCAHLVIWCVVLWRISRLDLRLIPTHPDLAGGLGPLGVAQVALSLLTFASSAMLVASYSESILYAGVRPESVVVPLASAVAGSTLMIVLPLLFFMPALLALKQQGVLEYSPLAARYVREFDTKWIRGRASPEEPLLGSADVQSLADLSNAFNVLRSMRGVPISLSQVLIIAGAAALPCAPLILFVIPLDELILRSVRTILHV